MPAENNNNLDMDNSAKEVDEAKISETGGGPTKPDMPTKSKKVWAKLVLAALVILVLLGVTAFIAYRDGKDHQKIVNAAPALKQLTLPRQATVYSACTPGRGEQYVVPSTLPNGPIYDVQDNKVIAIEYVLNFTSLLQNSSSFSSTILSLTRDYPVDHFTLVPDTTQTSAATSQTSAAAQAAAASQNIHLIMFIVPQSVADSITCSNTSGSTGSPSNSTNSSSSTSSTTSTNKSSSTP